MSDTTVSRGEKKPPHLSVRELVLLALMGAIMFAGQVVMGALPNIEPVTLLVMAGAAVFGLKSLYSVYVFVILEALLYGLNIWVINYMYVWTVLALVVIALRKVENYVLWSAIAGAFGLFFGALCAIPYFFISGPMGALAYWLSGIPFDLIHCVANAVIAFALLKPTVLLLRRLAGAKPQI